MTKKETAQVLAIIRAAFPNVKIEDAAATCQSWYMELSDYSASSVIKAARLHISTSKFFPTVAEIKAKIVRAELVYPDDTLDTYRLSGPAVKAIADPEIKLAAPVVTDEQLEDFCKWVGLGYPNDCEED